MPLASASSWVSGGSNWIRPLISTVAARAGAVAEKSAASAAMRRVFISVPHADHRIEAVGDRAATIRHELAAAVDVAVAGCVGGRLKAATDQVRAQAIRVSPNAFDGVLVRARV